MIDIENPNRVQNKMKKVGDLEKEGSAGPKPELTRKERYVWICSVCLSILLYMGLAISNYVQATVFTSSFIMSRKMLQLEESQDFCLNNLLY